jgi:hypothetical protein
MHKTCLVCTFKSIYTPYLQHHVGKYHVNRPAWELGCPRLPLERFPPRPISGCRCLATSSPWRISPPWLRKWTGISLAGVQYFCPRGGVLSCWTQSWAPSPLSPWLRWSSLLPCCGRSRPCAVPSFRMWLASSLAPNALCPGRRCAAPSQKVVSASNVSRRKMSVCNSSLCTGCGPGLTRRGRDGPGVMSLATLSLGSMMTHKYRGSQQSSRKVKPKFIDSTQEEPKDIYKA